VVDFLPERAADAFSLRGGPVEVAGRLVETLRASPAVFDYVVLPPIPDPSWPADLERDFTARVAREVLPLARRALGSYPSCLWTTSTMREIVRSTAGDIGFLPM